MHSWGVGHVLTGSGAVVYVGFLCPVGSRARLEPQLRRFQVLAIRHMITSKSNACIRAFKIQKTEITVFEI